jgi:hypothetical protein
MPDPKIEWLDSLAKFFSLSVPVLIFLAFALYAGTSAATEAPVSWLNIQGDPEDPSADTLEVDPIPVSLDGSTRVMRVRVSRGAPQSNWDGVPYRSFESDVLFNCAGGSARYVAVSYYMLPAWKGRPHAAFRYKPGRPRPMRLHGMEGSPTARIVRAACQSGAVAKS